METHFAKGKGNDQSCDVEKEAFVLLLIFILNFHVAKGKEMRSRITIKYPLFKVSQLLCVDQFKSLFLNVVKCSIFY